MRVDGKDQQNQLSSSRRDHLQAPSPDPISNLFRRVGSHCLYLLFGGKGSIYIGRCDFSVHNKS